MGDSEKEKRRVRKQVLGIFDLGPKEISAAVSDQPETVAQSLEMEPQRIPYSRSYQPIGKGNDFKAAPFHYSRTPQHSSIDAGILPSNVQDVFVTRPI